MGFIVVFGGESWEHEISIVSAITLKKELKNIAHFIFIDAENEAYLIPRESMKSTHFSSLAYKKNAQVSFTKGGFLQNGFLKKQILRGVVINLIHGKSGEDGQIAGILDFYQIPFIGPRIEACAVSFSKELTKVYAKARGVRVLDYLVLDSAKVNPSLRADSQNLRGNPPCEKTQDLQNRWLLRYARKSYGLPRSHSLARNDDSILDSAIPKQEANSAIADEFLGFCEASDKDRTRVHRGSEPKQSLKSRCESEFAFPCIVKPSHLGSSLGIAIAKSQEDLPYALDCAFEYDTQAIIEPFIPHIREFNLAGCKVNGEFIFSIIEEVKKDEFFAFEDKYLDFQGGGNKKEADLSEEVAQKIKANFKAIYENCFEGALIRCDFFMLDNEIYLNEINPIPGSMAHYLFDDFNAVLQNLAQNLPQKRKIQVKYQYISKIQAQKGK